MTNRPSRSIKLLLNTIAFIVVGLAVGYFTVDLAVTRGFSPITQTTGPWTLWPQAASIDADPYTRAHFASFGKLGLVQFEALEYRAERDSSGARLDQACTYVLSGASLDGRWWNIAAYDDNRRPLSNRANRHSFNSENILRDMDGAYRIVLSSTPHPGNWLPLGSGGAFRLILTIVDPPAAYRGSEGSVPLPRIERRSC